MKAAGAFFVSGTGVNVAIINRAIAHQPIEKGFQKSFMALPS
jgi:hypothetical protein